MNLINLFVTFYEEKRPSNWFFTRILLYTLPQFPARFFSRSALQFKRKTGTISSFVLRRIPKYWAQKHLLSFPIFIKHVDSIQWKELLAGNYPEMLNLQASLGLTSRTVDILSPKKEVVYKKDGSLKRFSMFPNKFKKA